MKCFREKDVPTSKLPRSESVLIGGFCGYKSNLDHRFTQNPQIGSLWLNRLGMP